MSKNNKCCCCHNKGSNLAVPIHSLTSRHEGDTGMQFIMTRYKNLVWLYLLKYKNLEDREQNEILTKFDNLNYSPLHLIIYIDTLIPIHIKWKEKIKFKMLVHNRNTFMAWLRIEKRTVNLIDMIVAKELEEWEWYITYEKYPPTKEYVQETINLLKNVKREPYKYFQEGIHDSDDSEVSYVCIVLFFLLVLSITLILGN